MAIKKYKPTSPARRHMSVSAFEEITTKTPEKTLLAEKNKTGGRNSYGRITVRHIGGGNRQKYRIIDFKRLKDNIPAKVAEIEYDPNRTANIALLHYADGEKRYILAPVGLNKGDIVESGENADIKAGNNLPISAIPVGTMIHNIERATIGQVGNLDHEIVKLGKAGKTRHMGVRPSVRGVVMNPCDHPHGGGEGKSPVGMPSPVTPWGKPTLGYKTRKKSNKSNKFIIKRVN